jgi:glycosyltransferase involved in cell wall biosynthesis
MHATRPDVPPMSILLPVRDAGATLPAALDSVRRQTETGWECVVVDDGSTDDSLAIMRRFVANDPRFVVVATEHRGLVAALHEGLAHCRAPLVVRFDADDVMHRERLAAQRAALGADPSLALVGCHVRMFPRARLQPGRLDYERWLNAIGDEAAIAREVLVECPLAHPTWCARRDVLLAHGYRDCGWPEDYDLLLRLHAAGRRIGVVPRRLLLWRDREDRLSRHDPRYSLAAFTACKAAHLAGGFLAASDAYVLWGYGATGRALRRALLAHGRWPAAIVEVHPGRIGNRIHGAPVIPPDQIAGLAGLPIVVSVAGAAAREWIRAACARLDLVELRDYRFAA